jgi:UDP-GlcNAc:undecaprenyl-phosphate GlcNAc-1-phosphate transferase
VLTDLWIPILISTATTFATILIASKFALNLHLVDLPVGRKQHDAGTPMVGGLGIVAGLLTLFFTAPDLFMQHWVIFTCVVALMIVGVIDDVSHIHSAVRMMIQIGVGCAIYFMASLPFLSVGDIWFIGDLGLGPYSLTFTCIAVVGGVNAINMMDGLDGLCGTMVASPLALLSGMAYLAGDTELLALSSVLLGTVVVFLAWNYRFPWNKSAKVFLGDNGAYVLGFMIAALFLMASQGSYKSEVQVITPITALWLLFIPLIDIAGVIWRRSRFGRWPVDDDREHLHYLLVDRGISTERVVIGMFLTAVAFGGLGVGMQLFGVSESWSFVVFMTFGVLYFVLTNKLSRKR